MNKLKDEGYPLLVKLLVTRGCHSNIYVILSHYMEASFWRRLWNCRQTEY